MRATVMMKAGDVRIQNVPDARLIHPTDALIRITRACICGSDLWPYTGGPNVEGQQMGHEAIGLVEAVGSDVRRIRPGQVVIMPFAFSDGSCIFCDEGLQTACTHGHRGAKRHPGGGWASEGSCPGMSGSRSARPCSRGIASSKPRV